MPKIFYESKTVAIGEVLKNAQELLKLAGLEVEDALYLLSEVTGLSQNMLQLSENEKLSGEKKAEFIGYIEKRLKRIPAQYITGRAYFFGEKFAVTEDTLIPRKETEILVEKALDKIDGTSFAEVLDLGSGSGNIAISIALNSEAHITSLDISEDALNLARFNANKHDLADRITFKNSDMLSLLSFPPEELKEKFDMIVSNPPYVSRKEYEDLPDEVLNEPRQALWAGEDGLKYIKAILSGAEFFLKDGGWLLIETGAMQKDAVLSAARANKSLKDAVYIKDYSGMDRIFTCRIQKTQQE